MTAPLRILKVSHGFPPLEQAGAELCAAGLSREFLRRGHEVSVFTRTGRESQGAYTVESEDQDGLLVRRVRTPAEHATSLQETYENPKVRRLFEEELRRGVDIVHIHHLFGLSTDLIEAARLAGARVVLTLHDFWYLCPRGQRFTPRGHLCTEIEPWRCSLCIAKKRVRWGMNATSAAWQEGAWKHPLRALGGAVQYFANNLHLQPIERRKQFILAQLNRADLCVSPSQFVLDEYLRHGLQGPTTGHSENGMESGWAQARSEARQPRRPRRFGFVGTFLPSKGVDLLVDAFQEVPEGVAELHLHGTSLWDGGKFARQLENTNRHPAVRFHGAFAHDRLPQVLDAVDVLVVPSRWFENAPLTLDEAALARLPVIAADHGGMKEFVERRGNGLLFAPGDRRELHQALLRLAEDDALWASLADPKVAVRTVEDQADELLEHYQRLLS